MKLGVLGAILLIATVYESAQQVKPLPAGTKAPDASVVTLAGKTTTLAELRGGERSVLIFYRGGW